EARSYRRELGPERHQSRPTTRDRFVAPAESWLRENGPAKETARTMKIEMFHLMPYRGLPEDFRERYHSVWVDVPNQLCDPAVAHELYNQTLDELELAAELGFDGICVTEHHQNAYAFMPSPNVMPAPLA